MSRAGAVALLWGAAGAAASAQVPEEVIRFHDRVEVESVIVDARVVDGRGRPILGLEPHDFRVKVDGHVVELQSATWVADDAAPDPEATAAAREAGVSPPPAGRLIVFFFQKDLDPTRVTGFMQMLRRAREMLSDLRPEDRVAVASFDSYLRLFSDFTTDRARLRRILDRGVLFESRPSFNVEEEPSLAARFDTAEGKRAASPEAGLLLLAQALEDLPGTKSLVMFGWGMGRWSPGMGVFLEKEYGPAQRALARGRVAVFALDVTNADWHTLEVGLEQVAEDTGGFYEKTHLFPGQAMKRLEGALSGHYVLTFARPDVGRGEHEIDIGLVGRKGTVLAKRTYEG